MQQSKTVITSLLALIGIAVVGGGVYYARNSSGSTPTTDTTASGSSNTGTSGTTGTVSDTTTTSKYKDGTYSATGNYISPGGKQSVSVTLTLAGDVVTTVSVQNGAIDRESSKYQNKFIGGVSSYVVGKNIDSLMVDEVSGSSLTGAGFNDAVAKIKTQAGA